MSDRGKIRITPDAEAQIKAADGWWQLHRQAAPWALRDDLQSAFELLLMFPESGFAVPGLRAAGIRRIPLKKTGYILYYRPLIDGAGIEVHALWHGSRDAGPDL